MKIVIAGAGEVGTHLAKLLSREEQDITLLDRDRSRLEALDASYNLLTVVGSPVSFSALRAAGVEKAELFIAVTPYETDNVVACEIAKSFGAQKTVARIDNYEFMDPANSAFFTRSGINHTIYPEYLAALEIRTALERNWVRNWFELHDGEIIVVGIKLRDNARIAGMQLKEFAATRHNFHVSAIRRKNETIIPRGDDRLMPNDILYFTTTRDYVDELIDLCGKTRRRIHNIMIMGGSRIAVRLVSLIGSKNYDVKILERDRDKCAYLAERCPEAEIIHGDGRDIEVLRQEGVEATDAFIALSDSSETNILACLSAKEMGVKKTIAEVENIQFISEAENLNIGTIINKKLLASSRIFQILLDSDANDSRCLALTDAEVSEIEAKPRSKITRAPVRDLHLSRDLTIAGLVRDGRGMLVDGSTTICAGDRVVVFCLDGSLHKVERLFS